MTTLIIFITTGMPWSTCGHCHSPQWHPGPGDHQRSHLAVHPAEWAAFVAGVRDGEFDYHTQAAALLG